MKIFLLFVIAAFVVFGADSVKAQDSSTRAKDRKLKIIKKTVPFPEGNCSGNEGLVTVRATFDKSGKVTAVGESINFRSFSMLNSICSRGGGTYELTSFFPANHK